MGGAFSFLQKSFLGEHVCSMAEYRPANAIAGGRYASGATAAAPALARHRRFVRVTMELIISSSP